jgi:hypothetical protein
MSDALGAVWDWIKAHPWLTGAIVGGLLILWWLMNRGEAAPSAQPGIMEGYWAAEAAAAATGNALQVEQLRAQAAVNVERIQADAATKIAEIESRNVAEMASVARTQIDREAGSAAYMAALGYQTNLRAIEASEQLGMQSMLSAERQAQIAQGIVTQADYWAVSVPRYAGNRVLSPADLGIRFGTA